MLLAAMAITACAPKKEPRIPSIVTLPTTAQVEITVPSETTKPEEAPAPHIEGTTAKKNNDIVILATSDVHCCPQKGFGYAGLYRIREKFLKQGCEVLLVDDGDEFEGHGELFGTVTQGEQVVELMNKMGYDVAIPGNHDFNYGPDRFMELTKKANYPYLSCNIYKYHKLLLQPYIIKEVSGRKIAFVGMTTPRTLGYYTSLALFQDADGDVVYDFNGGNKNKKLVSTIQSTVNAARAAGADYVVAMTHFGQAKKYKAHDEITYIIQKTQGIDVFLDGHSHDNRKFEVVNAAGKSIQRIAMGSKFSRIGYVRISGTDGSIETGIYHWNNSVSIPDLFGIENEMSEEVDKAIKKYNATFNAKQGTVSNQLVLHDPEKKDKNGNPINKNIRGETNLGDLAADAFRAATGADVAIIPGDKFKRALGPGDVKLKDCYNTLPSSKKIIAVNATGQQILDALEWGCRTYPDGNKAFPQVSGITFHIDTKTKNPCKIKKGNFKEVKGKRRISNVKINGVPIDASKTYKVASYISMLKDSGNGYTMFMNCKRVKSDGRLDFQILADYIRTNLKGNVGKEYADPNGQKRITAS